MALNLKIIHKVFHIEGGIQIHFIQEHGAGGDKPHTAMMFRPLAFEPSAWNRTL